jgi:hypothetical protein
VVELLTAEGHPQATYFGAPLAMKSVVTAD